jgi:type II secretion system protein N
VKRIAWARALSLALAAIVLTALFVAWLFPYERVADRLSSRASAWAGIELRFDDLGLALSWGGVGIEARNTLVTLPGSEPFVLPSAFARPAWTPRWLLADPRFVISIDGGELGQIDAVVSLGGAGSLDTQLDGVRVEALPLDLFVPGLSMEGLLSGRIELSIDEHGEPVGGLDLEFSQGNLMAPGLPMSLPYERLNADIELGGEVSATIRALAVTGPLLSATLEGTVGRSAVRGAEPLDLDMQIQRVGRGIRPMLQQLGVELASAGPTLLQITGTLARPTFR